MKIKSLALIPTDKRPQCQAMIRRYSFAPKVRCSKHSAFKLNGVALCKLHAGEFALRYMLNRQGEPKK